MERLQKDKIEDLGLLPHRLVAIAYPVFIELLSSVEHSSLHSGSVQK